MNLIEALVNSVREKNLLAEAYSITKVPEPISEGGAVAEDSQALLTLIVNAAVASQDFRKKVFQPDYPAELGQIGYMSDVDLDYAINSGFRNAAMIADYIERHCNLAKNANILDFGCGTLRVCRYLIQFAEDYNYSACDVNPFSIKWAQSEFYNRGNIFLMDNKPPLTLGEESMDFAFAWSIFSHYSESAHWAWLKELHRILRPGGHLFITFQGEILLNRMRNEKDIHACMRAENVDQEGVRKNFLNRGFGFYECYPESEDDFGFDLENFGMAFISPAYIEREWTKLFEVVRIDLGAVANFQDVVLLRKL